MTRPIHVVARFFANPSRLPDFEALAKGLLAPTRAEPGCVRYDLWQNRAAPTEFVMIEEWRSEADLDRHLETPHVAAAKARLPDLVTKPLEITRYDRVG
jgi:quinol monooxygenase YgiN